MGDRDFLPAAVVFYSLLGATAYVWMWLRGEPAARVFAPGVSAGVGLQVFVGVAVGAGVVFLGRVMEKRFEFARRLSAELKELLPPLRTSDIVLVAAFSSLGEELFFRGAMQDALGFWITAIAFAIVHGFFDRKFLVWMVFAGLMALVFGYMTIALGTILAPTIAHFTINAVNLRYLVDRPTEAAP